MKVFGIADFDGDHFWVLEMVTVSCEEKSKVGAHVMCKQLKDSMLEWSKC